MKKELLTGNQAVVKGCLAIGAQMMTGYPITPTSEILEEWSFEVTKNPNLKFLQTEDEMAAGFSMIGAILAGLKAFTATAGPGNVLMQDAFSMAENMRIPTVSFINQRGGPSTGTVIYSQQELNLTCFGGNGEGLRIVYSVGTVQEMYDYAIKAFNTAWKYRFPTFVLSDGYNAKTSTEIETYNLDEKQIENIEAKAILLNPQKEKGKSVNLRNTYNLETELNEIIERNNQDFQGVSSEIIEYQDYHTLDSDLVIFAHGIVSITCKNAVDALRAQGKKVSLFRPITLNPFPKENAQAVIRGDKKILVVESSLGQFNRLLEGNIYGASAPIHTLYKPAMGVTQEDIENKVNEIMCLVK